jgi:polysaccharide biosynthesis transport protein
VESLEHILGEAKIAAENSARAQIPLNAMNRDLEAGRGQLQAILDRIQQTAQQAAIESSEAHEISQAIPPEHPSSPHTMQVMVGSTAAAVFLGLLLVYLLHLIDSTLHSGAELRDVTGLPCFALLPEVGKRALGHLKVHDYVVRRPLTPFAEQVRALRTALALDIDHPHVITVTAALPGEGKSHLTLSLGRSAQLAGERVLAIDCDIRQATFQHRLGGRSAPGLMEVLRGEAAWRDVIQDDPLSAMKFIAAGKPGGDVVGLFLSDRMRQLLADLRDNYDLILMDTPPVESMTESRVAAVLADATLLCVRWRSTRSETLLRTLEVLHDTHAKVIGTVLTRVDTRVHLRSGYADSGVYHRRHKAYFQG